MNSTHVNVHQCHCCGQIRPYPTEPGEWEYCESISMDNPVWVRVTVKLPSSDDRDGQFGLRLVKDGELIWWPCNSAWRKV